MRVVDIVFAFPLLVLAILIVGLLGPSRTQRDDRDRRSSTCPRSPASSGRGARGDGLPVHRVGALARRAATSGSCAATCCRTSSRPLTVLTTVYFSQAILAEATLSFLGLGTQPPEAAWGNMLATARELHRLERLDGDLARARDHARWCSGSTSSATACATSSTRASAARRRRRSSRAPRSSDCAVIDLLIRDALSSTAPARRRSAATSRSRADGSSRSATLDGAQAAARRSTPTGGSSAPASSIRTATATSRC